jgi:hypothetical protein
MNYQKKHLTVLKEGGEFTTLGIKEVLLPYTSCRYRSPTVGFECTNNLNTDSFITDLPFYMISFGDINLFIE